MSPATPDGAGREAQLRDALETLWSWCRNWGMPWEGDEEWPEDEAKIRAALAAAAAPPTAAPGGEGSHA